jgi:wyosine [tRNA(Phe)-imidazoG37] synthetase (radical SAM superfamily)
MSPRSYVFGPVPSRRLGRSLGVDLVPMKTCPYDCVYCQLGRTTASTVERRLWVPVAEVLEQVRAKLDSRPDHVTLSGSGEPTLHSGIGEVIAGIHAATDVPVAVLTNGSLLWLPEVRRDILAADVVLPTLVAADAETFGRVNRPHGGVEFERMLDGLSEFRREFRGRYWLEVMLIGGMTASPDQARRIAQAALRIGPDRIQLNTVTRPPADPSARPATREELEAVLPLFGDKAEIIADWRGASASGARARKEEVLGLVRRHPCTADDVAAGLGIPCEEARRLAEGLREEGLLETESLSGREYYKSKV